MEKVQTWNLKQVTKLSAGSRTLTSCLCFYILPFIVHQNKRQNSWATLFHSVIMKFATMFVFINFYAPFVHGPFKIRNITKYLVSGSSQRKIWYILNALFSRFKTDMLKISKIVYLGHYLGQRLGIITGKHFSHVFDSKVLFECGRMLIFFILT